MIKRILLFYLAFIIWIAKILMCLTIILIPIERYLSYTRDLWRNPFKYMDDQLWKYY